jgi:hypothetical protein
MMESSKGPESSREEIRKLLALFRRGAISEEDLLLQLDDWNGPTSRAPPRPLADEDTERARRRSLIAVLDQYRVAEESGAETLRAWSNLSGDPALTGGLRTIAAREAYHAELLGRRVQELGGEPSATIPDWLSEYNARMVDPRVTDVDRLEAIVGQFPDIEAALAPLEETIASIDGDPLTRELLRTIEQDERASLEWFHSAYATRSIRG